LYFGLLIFWEMSRSPSNGKCLTTVNGKTVFIVENQCFGIVDAFTDMEYKVTEGAVDMVVVGTCESIDDTVAYGLYSNTQVDHFTQMNRAADEVGTQGTTHGTIEVSKQDCANSRGILFHIDSGQIAPVVKSEQSSELHDLGLTVFNQEDYEQGIAILHDSVKLKLCFIQISSQ